jgi:MFS transporter, DHA2 family, multidrug resistance protein
MSDLAGCDVAARASTADWIAVFAGALGALMASLDISITNSALPQIQGEIGASGTEGTWISTGYIVSEVVIIPLAAWLTRVLGLRNLLLGCAVMFTFFSVVCACSTDLHTLIIGRVGQGLTGGALIPTAQAIIRTRLPAKQMSIGMTIFGLIVLIGPLAGPVIGGWLTENANWRWCFFLNVPVAAALIALLLCGLPHMPVRPALLLDADWTGIIGLTTCLSCFTVVLEEGQRERWFESNLILCLCAMSLLGFALLLIGQITARAPVIKLRLLLNPRYAGVVLIVFAVGTALYGILYALPQFLSNIAAYNAEQSGLVLFISGVPAFLIIPILPRLLQRVDIRLLVFAGLLCLVGSCLLDIHLTADSSGDDFTWSQLLRGLGQVLALMPLNQASVGAVSMEDAADAAGLYNMARNLGGSFGVATLGTFIDRHIELHSDIIRETVTANSTLVQERVAGMAAALLHSQTDAVHAHAQALHRLSIQIHQQALVMTYSECFWLLGMGLLASLPLVLLLGPAPTRRLGSMNPH